MICCILIVCYRENVIFVYRALHYEFWHLIQVVEVLTESLTLKETPIPTKVARLMLVSDVLHNSSAPVRNASAYRTKFEATLPDIMESFNDLYRSITGRITAEALKVSFLLLSRRCFCSRWICSINSFSLL